MNSNAFKGQGRRLGSSSDSNVNERNGSSVKGLWPTRQDDIPTTKATQIPSGSEVESSLPPSNRDQNARRGSVVSIASTASLMVAATQDSVESASKKRKRRASTASTASLSVPSGISSDVEVIAPPVQKRIKGEEIIDLLTEVDRKHWSKWMEQQTDQIDPLESLETWYHDIRGEKTIYERDDQTRVSKSRKLPHKEIDSAMSSSSRLTPPILNHGLTTVTNIKDSSKTTAPGAFRNPTVLKTWCFGYPRERDIKLEEILQRNHLSSVVISAFVWDMDFWWSKINRAITPCQLIIQRDHIEEGTLLQDGPNRIILHPENTKILHSKFMLLFFEEAEMLRLVITTANMLAFDWGEEGGFMENMVFLIDLPKISTKRDQKLTQFGIDFSEYCVSLGLTSNIVNQLKNYDWEGTRDLIFVCTHGRVSQEMLPSTGLAGLSQKLAQADLAYEGEIEIDYVSSSIGRLNWEFLSYLYQACKGQKSLPTPAKCKNMTKQDELLQNIRVYYASQETVEASKGGAGNACKDLCFYPSNYHSLGEEKQVFYDCKSQRPGCVMHSKILFVRPKSVDPSGSQSFRNTSSNPWFEGGNWRSTTVRSSADLNHTNDEIVCNTSHTPKNNAALPIRRSPTAWVYIGSANCSWAAWCNPRNCKKQEDEYNTGSNWECGVVIPVRSLQSGHGSGRLDIFNSIVPVPMRTDTEKLNPQSRRPFLVQ